MQLTTNIITLNKRFPFTISRGTRLFSKNIFVYVRNDVHEGLGECDPGCGDTDDEVIQCQQLIDAVVKSIDLNQISIHSIWQQMHEAGLPKPLQAAVDIALWDLLGKKAGLSCFQLFGLSTNSVPTSITLGITPLELISLRVEILLAERRFRFLKIKLGSPEGLDHDQQIVMLAKKAAAPFDVGLRVDANGGWSLSHAQKMCTWLAKLGVEYVEQPLHVDNEDALPHLFRHRPLPIYLDESCHLSRDIVRVAHFVDGVNIKLMKCGGLTEALRMVATARAHGIKTMIGCMSESSVAIAAGASIAALFDHVDLDSCFNLSPDPAAGLAVKNGVVTPNNSPGHGGYICSINK